MITVQYYPHHCDDSLDQDAAVVTELGDDLVNTRLPGIQGSQRAIALVPRAAGGTETRLTTATAPRPMVG